MSLSCSRSGEEQAAQHVSRGDAYAEQHQLAEAIIEYKNAARATPRDAAVQWKLAQAALELKDLHTAVAALQRAAVAVPTHYDAMFTLGQIYLAAGKIPEVRRLAQNIIDRHPKRPGGYLLQGRMAARDGDVQTAIARFRQAVECEATDQTMIAIGHLYVLAQDIGEARAWYDRAVSDYPTSIEAHIARGNFYFAVGRPGEGERDFQHAVNLAKDSENMRLAIAVQHVAQGRPELAERELAAVAQAMNSRRARILLTELKLDLGRVPQAKPLLTALLREDPGDTAVLYLQGRIALAERRPHEARAFLQDVLHRDPKVAAAHLYLGVADLLEGRRAEGEAHLLEATRLDADNPKPHLMLAEWYLSQHAFVRAEQEAFEVLRGNPAHVQAAIVYGDSFFMRDDWAKAEAVYSALVTRLPDSPIGLTKMAMLKRRQGLSSKAVEFLAEALKRNPDDQGLLSDYLLTLVAAEKTGEARRFLQHYLTKSPHDPVRWEIAARVYSAMRRPKEAEEALKEAMDLAPERPQALQLLAQLYLSQKKLAAAEAALRKLLQREETIEAAHTSLGLVLAAQGRIDEANEQYRRAIELQPTDYVAANNLAAGLLHQGAPVDEALRYGKLALDVAPTVPAVQDTVGWIYFKKGSLEEAYPLLARAVSELGDDPTVRFHHAMALAQRGDTELAAVELEKALSLSTSFPGADEAATTLTALRK